MQWIRSSFCDTSACVEVARSENGDVMIRDSATSKSSPFWSLWFSPDEWDAFLAGMKAGDFDGV